MAKREDIYRAQLKELGIYEEAFEPEIATLAKLERRKTRAEKAWSATVPKGEKPSFLDPHYQILVQLEREILVHRETLGLTPKALRKLRGVPTAAGADEPALITRRLDLIAQRVSCYELPEPGSLDPDVAQAYAEESQSDWRALVPTLDTGTGGDPSTPLRSAQDDRGERIATPSCATVRNDRNGEDPSTRPAASFRMTAEGGQNDRTGGSFAGAQDDRNGGGG